MGDTSPTPLTENPDERRMFDDWAKLCGSPLKAIAASLTTISKTLPPHGSFSMSLAIYSNEIAKAEATISASSRRVDELREALVDMLSIAECWETVTDKKHFALEDSETVKRAKAALSTTPATRTLGRTPDDDAGMAERVAENVKNHAIAKLVEKRGLRTPGTVEVCAKCCAEIDGIFAWDKCAMTNCPMKDPSRPTRKDQWRDISTAPLDGTWVNAYSADAPIWRYGRADIFAFQQIGPDFGAWVRIRDEGPAEDQPTHWTPLLEPPAITRPAAAGEGT